MSEQRRRYLFRGNVQGVGFRMSTRRIARAYPVTGYVRNLPDGRVEVVVDGDPETVAAFLGAVQREFEGYIEGVDQESAPADESNYEGFEIRY